MLSLAGPSMFGMNAGWLEQTCSQSTVGGRHWMPPARKKAKVRYQRWAWGIGGVEWSGEQIKQFNIPSFPNFQWKDAKGQELTLLTLSTKSSFVWFVQLV